MKKIPLVTIVIILLIPKIVFGAWWNPFSWFNWWNFFKQNTIEVIEIEKKNENIEIISDQNVFDDKKVESTTSDFRLNSDNYTEKKNVIGETNLEEKNEKEVVEEKTIILEKLKEEQKIFNSKEIYNEWSKSVVNIYCTIDNSEYFRYSNGSGFLTLMQDGSYVILTTPHVYTIKGEKADECLVTFPETKEQYKIYKEKMLYNKNYSNDKGWLLIDKPSNYLKNLINTETYGYGIGERNCQLIEINEPIILIGYPYGSNKNNASFSEGEIIEYDDPYYVSDATIKTGYSGGIAISLKNNCMFGIVVYLVKDNPKNSMIFDIQKY